MNRRHLVYYLLLNVFVSACVTSAILYWYDRNYRAVALPPLATASLSTSEMPSAATVPAGTVRIISVVGAGTLTAETVTIQYKGDGELDLTGWRLKDADGNVFTFPPFKLFRNGAVQVHTTSGTNTAIDLYWGRRQAVWQPGETALLTDAGGNVLDAYPVP